MPPFARHLSVIIALAALAPATAWAQKADGNVSPAAKKHADKAKTHFDLQEYDEALTELKTAYRIDPEPTILYAIAQAYRMKGDCKSAIVSYESFLRTRPSEAQKKATQENIERCKESEARAKTQAETETQAQPAPEPQPEPAPRPPPEPEPRPPPPPSDSGQGGSWLRNWVGHGLVLSGIAASAGGLYLARNAQRDIDAVNDAQFYDEFLELRDEADAAKTRRSIGFGAVAGGGALILAGVVAYLVMDTGPERTAAISLTPDGKVGVAWSF